VNNEVFAKQNNFSEARTSSHWNYPENNYCQKLDKIFFKWVKQVKSIFF
jgi:hypothetical protein